ncbi:MAG TPA: hypothetical protein VGH28_12835 [Polyangiaceae bacterium]|jgi:hypothetical protein
MKKLLLLIVLLSCDDPALVVVDDAYGDSTAVDAAWWRETLVPDHVQPGASSPAYRATVGSNYAYLLLERNGALFVARTKNALSNDRGDTLHVVVSPHSIVGDCAGGTPLTQAEADFITGSIFPGPFEGAIYDAATCKTFKPGDAGAD